MSWTNQTKNQSSYKKPNQYGKGSWDDNYASWDDISVFWDGSGISFTNPTKHSSTYTNQPKS